MIKSTFNYSKKEIVDHVDEIEHELVREAMRFTGLESGVEITTLADIPSEGSGLGSSSTVTVALLHAFYTYQNTLVGAEQLASEACKIEIDILGKPIGRQDQYIGGIWRYGEVYFFLTTIQSNVCRFKALTEITAGFLPPYFLYYTGIVRSADNILAEQKENYLEQEKFEVMSEMVSLVEPFRRAAEEGDVELCGKLLDKNWELKQRMASGITNTQIMEMYDKAKAAGAIGGKIAGAGGGGFLMLIVPREKQNAVFEAMKDYREMPFMLERSGSKVFFDSRGYSAK